MANINEFKDCLYQCKVENNGNPKLYPNEKILAQEKVRFHEESRGIPFEVYHGTAFVTTYRLVYVKAYYGVEIPFHYVEITKNTDENLISSDKIDIILDSEKIRS